MIKQNCNYQLLVVEDNPGDRLIIEDFLEEKFSGHQLHFAESFGSVKTVLKCKNTFDLILMDLSLPDAGGEKLVEKMIQLAGNVPIIVLTGYADIHFSVKALTLGITDYIIKDELSENLLYKSVVYSIERKKIQSKLAESEKRYSDIFSFSPIPMFVYDLQTSIFVFVNTAAQELYGYTENEFLKMKYSELEHEISIQNDQYLKHIVDLFFTGKKKHVKKNGEVIFVEIRSADINFGGSKKRLIIIQDKTEQLKYIMAIEERNKALQEIAWIQSHVIRSPLARLKGLLNLLSHTVTEKEKNEILDLIYKSADDLDSVIEDITIKSSDSNFRKKSD